MPDTVISSANYAFLQDYVGRRAGLSLGTDKEYFIESRLMPVARARNLTSVNDLCALLRATETQELRTQVVNAVTTNETYFFRDPALFEALRDRVLPDLVGKTWPSAIRVWSAAASSGQEAYSLLMMCLESRIYPLPEILATDLSTEILERGQNGVYRQIEVNRGLPAPLLLKYFSARGRDWQINRELREAVKYCYFDLRNSMLSLGPFELIFCRNVLIYFDPETRAQVLRSLLERLAPGGYLALGGTESILDPDFPVKRCVIGQVTLYQQA